MTQDLINVGKILEIKVLDHVVIGQGRFVSIRERGLSELQLDFERRSERPLTPLFTIFCTPLRMATQIMVSFSTAAGAL